MLLAESNSIDPPTQAAMMLALLGIVLLGVALIVITLLGGRWVRRLGKKPKSSINLDPQFRQTEILEKIRIDKQERQEGLSSVVSPAEKIVSKETDSA